MRALDISAQIDRCTSPKCDGSLIFGEETRTLDSGLSVPCGGAVKIGDAVQAFTQKS